MKVTKEIAGTHVTVKVEGEVNAVTAPELDAQIGESLEGIEELIIDMTDTEYISSAGLRVLLAKHKIMSAQGSSMILRGVNDEIKEILDETGLIDVLNLE